MIDLHAHILPGLDDGPRTIESAVAMARVAAAAGTRAIATTSHIDHGYRLGPEELEAARAALAARLAEEGVELELLAGGEVAPARLKDLDDGALRRLALGGGPYLLLECPLSPVGAAMEPLVAELQRRGFGVLLAHPERSPTFVREPARLAPMIERGALAQLTTGSLTGEFGGTVRRAATAMLERRLVHVLASDAHHEVHRSPDLRAAADGLGDRLAEWMTIAVPAAIVAGDPLPERPPLPAPPRGVRARLRAWSAR
jgi:protein-tyrosine phosphatase